MIAHEHDHGVVPKIEPVHSSEYLTDLSVRKLVQAW